MRKLVSQQIDRIETLSRAEILNLLQVMSDFAIKNHKLKIKIVLDTAKQHLSAYEIN